MEQVFDVYLRNVVHNVLVVEQRGLCGLVGRGTQWHDGAAVQHQVLLAVRLRAPTPLHRVLARRQGGHVVGTGQFVPGKQKSFNTRDKYHQWKMCSNVQ